MAIETLSFPEEHGREVIRVIRAGLSHLARKRVTKKVTPGVRRQLLKWCKEEEEYLKRLEGSA